MTLEVDGDLMTVHTLYDWGSYVTLVRSDTARRGTDAAGDEPGRNAGLLQTIAQVEGMQRLGP